MSKPPVTPSHQEINPYDSPAIPSDRRITWTNPRLRRALDFFAIIFASAPLGVRITEESFGLTINGFMESVSPDFVRLAALMLIISILSMALLWLISLVVNIKGAFKLRPISLVGVLLNVASLVAMF